MLYKKDHLKVRELQKKDNILLSKWLSDPLVLEFYEGRDNSFNVEKVNKEFYNDDRDVTRCIVMYEEVSIGYIQYYLVNAATSSISVEHDEVVYGLDQFIGESTYCNMGIGTQLVTSMVDFLVEQKHADKVMMDPQINNKRAIRCYEKCGFKKIRMLPQHEWHEGAYRDCWLMEYKKLNNR